MVQLNLRQRDLPETLAAMRAAADRARRRIEGLDSRVKDTRLELMKRRDGTGHLLKPIMSGSFGDRRHIVLYLSAVDVREIWQLCTRTRQEFAELRLQNAQPMFSDADLDRIERYLEQFDLSFALGEN